MRPNQTLTDMEQPLPVPDSQPQEPQEPPMSLAGRLFNVFATPGEVFEQVAPRPVNTASWLVPALLLIVVSWLGLALVFSQESIRHQLGEITEQAIQKQAASQHMSEQHLERYLAEFDFRMSHRAKLGYSDDMRTEKALQGIAGKRLTYRRTDKAKTTEAANA